MDIQDAFDWERRQNPPFGISVVMAPDKEGYPANTGADGVVCPSVWLPYRRPLRTSATSCHLSMAVHAQPRAMRTPTRAGMDSGPVPVCPNPPLPSSCAMHRRRPTVYSMSRASHVMQRRWFFHRVQKSWVFGTETRRVSSTPCECRKTQCAWANSTRISRIEPIDSHDAVSQ